MMQISVREIMTPNVITVPATMPVNDVAAILDARHITGLPVVDDQGRVVGVISEYDIISRQGATAADIMSRQVISVDADTDAGEVAQLLTNRRIRRVPILDGERLIGIVSRSDLMRLFMLTRWVCTRCGYFERGFEQPAQCAACGASPMVLQREGANV